MKLYCMNCGFANEYIGIKPTKCESCKTIFEQAVKTSLSGLNKTKNEQKLERFQEELQESDFDSFLDFEPEPISREEIESIFLANASKPIRLKDLIKTKDVEVAEATKKTPKPRGRPRKVK